MQPAARGADSPSQGAGSHRPGRAASPPIPMSLKTPHGLLRPPLSYGGPQAQGRRRNGQGAPCAGPGEGQFHSILKRAGSNPGGPDSPPHSLPPVCPTSTQSDNQKAENGSEGSPCPSPEVSSVRQGAGGGAGGAAAARDPAKLPRAPFFLPVKSHNDTLQQPHSRALVFIPRDPERQRT